MNHEIVDPNLRVDSHVYTDQDGTKFYDIRQKPFAIYGMYQPLTEPIFRRLPDDVATATSAAVKKLARNSAGGRVRFCTDSPYIVLRAEIDEISHFSHMQLSGTAGFDLFIDNPEDGTGIYRKAFIPPYNFERKYDSKIDLGTKQMRYFTICFPSYSTVASVHIGVADGSELGEGMKYRDIAPVVFYGSSITQGACASRPGNSYQNMISRELNIDYINLGFSGSGKAEDAIVDYMATLPMSLFVSDYDHNAPNADYLRETNLRMYQKIRAAYPDLPYLMISRPDFHSYDNSAQHREAVLTGYRYALEQGDKNIAFYDGEQFFNCAFGDSCTVDASHPNDFGFARMAEELLPIIKNFLQ